MTAPRLLAAVIGAPHGVRGEVRLKSLTDDPLAVARYGALSDEAGARGFVIEALRLVKDDMCVARFKGVADRDAAAALTHTKLYALRANLPPAEKDEFYHADLIGLAAETASGVAVGTVIGVANYGAGDLIEIAPPGGGETLLLPFKAVFVPEVDVKGGRIIVAPPAETQ